MHNFNASISLCNYSTKPTNHEFEDMIFCQKELNIIQLAELIQQGYSTCHVFNKRNFMTTNKTLKNFKEAYFIVLDFDHSNIAMKEVLNTIVIKPSIAFETFSNKENDYRFKMIYLLDKVITDTNNYKRMTEMVFSIAFNNTDKNELRNVLDTSSYTANQMFHGTKSDKRIEVSDTVISIDLINGLFSGEENVFESYEEVFDYLNIPVDFKLESKSKTNKQSKGKTKSKGLKKCPIKRNKRIKPYSTTDFSYIPDYGTVAGDLFDMGINNEVYFIPSQYNNYHTIQISDNEYDQVYFWVGNQNIYAVNTYFIGGKQKVGYRKKTLQYAAHVLCNLYPGITDNILYLKLKDYVIKYFEQPSDIDNNYIKRLAKSVCSMDNHNNMGRKYFVLNPAFNHLSKSEKMKEIHKRKTEFMRYYILSNHDSSLTLNELADKMKLHAKTVKKYLDAEGICYIVDRKSNDNYKKFLEVYLIEENQHLSLRKLAEMIGLSKNTVGRYIEQFKRNYIFD